MENLVRVQFDLWSFFLAFGALQGILLVLILLSYRRNSSTQYLISMLLLLVGNLFNHLLLSTGLFLNFPHLLYLFTPTLYLLGPFYYWYIRSVIESDFVPKKVWLHLLPFFLAILLTLPFIFLSSDEKIAITDIAYQSGFIPLSMPTFLFIFGQILQSYLYIFNANKLLKSARAGERSRQIKKKIQWLEKFGLVFLIYWIVDLISLLTYLFLGTIDINVLYVTILCSAVFINFLVFFAIRNNKEFGQVLLNNQDKKYKYSSLSKLETDDILQRIKNYMMEEKPYLDHELSLTKLAEHLDVSANQISQVLNLKIGKSFYGFINEYRFEEARQRLLKSEYKHLTILAIAFDAGFNNKNTFNKVFKKYSGLTPSEYIKQNSQNQSN